MTNGHKRRHFFDTTRGRILRMLCFSPLTVSELAAGLGLTGNAVRTQLAVLEREALVRQSGLRKGVRKPHFAYQATSEARRLFPTGYEAVLVQLLDVLSERTPGRQRSRLLREAAQRLAEGPLQRLRSAGPRERLAELKAVVAACGAGFEIHRENGTLLIRACSCPLASAVASHPDLCALVAAVFSGALKTPVVERCERGDFARCRFELKALTVARKSRTTRPPVP
jgi:predicted ArsR family transcriptional regulator